AVAAGEELGLVTMLADEADRLLGRAGADVVEGGRDHEVAPVSAWIAAHTLRGLAGMGTSRTPRASQMALMTAGAAPIVPASPIPLTPSWLVGEGVTVWPRVSDGTSLA